MISCITCCVTLPIITDGRCNMVNYNTRSTDSHARCRKLCFTYCVSKMLCHVLKRFFSKFVLQRFLRLWIKIIPLKHYLMLVWKEHNGITDKTLYAFCSCDILRSIVIVVLCFFQTEVSVNVQAAANDVECQDLSVKVRVCAVHTLMLQSKLSYIC